MTSRKKSLAALALLLAAFIALSAIAFRTRSSDSGAERENIRLRQLVVRQYVSNGERYLAEGNFLGGLPWFVEALALDESDPRQTEIHRMRIGTILRRSPRLEQAWRTDADLTLGELTPDGRRAIAADRKIHVWDADSGRPVYPPLTHDPADRQVARLALSNDGRKLASAKEGSVVIWELNSGKELSRCRIEGTAVRLLFSPNADRLLVLSLISSNELNPPVAQARVFRAGNGEPASPLASSPNDVFVGDGSADFSPDGKLVIATVGKGMQILEAGQWKPLENPKHFADDESVIRLSFWREWGGDDKLLIAGDRGNIVSLRWKKTEEAAYGTYSIPSELSAVAVYWKEQRIFCAGDREYWHNIWGGPQAEWPRLGGRVHSAVYAAQGLWLVTAGEDGTLCIFDVKESNKLHARLSGQRLGRVSDDGRRLLTVTVSGLAQVWDLTPQEPFEPLDSAGWHESHPEYGTSHAPGLIALSPDGRRWLVGDPGRLEIWNAQTGEIISPLLPCPHQPRVQFSSTSSAVLVWGTASLDREDTSRTLVREIDVATGQTKPAIEVDASIVEVDANRMRGLSLEVDFGKQQSNVGIWDLTHGRLLASQRWDGAWSRAYFSPDRLHFYLQSDDGLFLRAGDVGSAAPSGPLIRFKNNCVALAFNDSGSRLVTSHDGRETNADESINWPGPVQIWDAESNRLVRKLAGDGYYGAILSRDGNRVVARDRTSPRIWDIDSGQVIIEPLDRRPGGQFTSAWLYNTYFNLAPWEFFDPDQHLPWATMSPDGKVLASEPLGGGPRLWNAKTGETITPPIFWPMDDYAVDWANHRLVGSGRFCRFQVWNFAPDKRSVSELRAWAQLLAGYRIDGRGLAVTIEPEDYKRLWQERPAALALPETSDHVWHSFQWDRSHGDLISHLNYLISSQPYRWKLYESRAKIHEEAKCWQAANADWSRAIGFRPDIATLWYSRALTSVHLGRWHDAADDFHKAVELGMDDVAPEEALARIAEGDRTGYQRVRTSILRQMKTKPGLVSAEYVNETGRLSEACLLLPADHGELAPVVASMTKLISNYEGKPKAYMWVLAAALYRSGHTLDALNRLNQALAIDDEQPETWFWLALVERALGHKDAARSWREKAVQWLASSENSKDMKWRRRVKLRVLREEIDAMR